MTVDALTLAIKFSNDDLLFNQCVNLLLYMTAWLDFEMFKALVLVLVFVLLCCVVFFERNL